MTEILEDDGCEDLEPDTWAGVKRFYDPRPQKEIEQLQAEFFQRGGVAIWVPPVELRYHKHGEYYGYSKPPTEAAKRKRAIIPRHKDQPTIERIDLYLSLNGIPTSRMHMCQTLEISDSTAVRILKRYFSEDERATPYQKQDWSVLRNKYEEDDQRRLAAIQACLDAGIRGHDQVRRTTGISKNVLARLITTYGLKIAHTTHKERELQEMQS